MISTMNYGQTGDKNSIAYPSANNNSLPRSISDDVDLYQGKVNINIPLHTIQTTNLSVPVSLSYEGGNGINHPDFGKPLTAEITIPKSYVTPGHKNYIFMESDMLIDNYPRGTVLPFNLPTFNSVMEINQIRY